MSTKFFTNKKENTLLTKFKGIFEHNKDIERFDALVGYLRASGYFAIRPSLENVPTIRILVGIDVDSIVEEYHRKGRLFLADTGKCINEFKKQLTEDIQQAAYTPEVEQGIKQFIEDVASKKLEIKAHPTKRLHAKIYIFTPKGFNEHKPGSVITGSSNLTAAGLGAENRAQNYEFNVLLHDYEDVKFASEEFEELWNEAVHMLPAYIAEVTKNSYLRDDLTPFEIYIKLLIEYFGNSIEYNPNSETDLPDGFVRLAYQMDAVTQGFMLLQKHNGFFLADVVGLGKTVIAVLTAKKFFYHNGFPSHLSETLLVVPPALKQGWQDTLDAFGLKYVKIITNGSLHKLRKVEKYDLVIVDEAHKFRNDTSDAYDLLQKICKTRTNRRLPDGSYTKKKVILISATPLNNRPKDIANQLMLFQDSKNSTLEIANLQRYFSNQQKVFDEALRTLSAAEARRVIQEIYEDIRLKILSEITIRRTRTDLLAHEDYKKDLEAQGIKFPKVGAPNKLLYQLSPALDSLYDETLVCLDRTLTYSRYQAIGNLVPEKKLRYQNAERISSQLSRIMRTLLLKRLDSSFHAFTRSLCRFRDATQVMVDMFAKGSIYIAPELNVTEHLLEGREDELIAKINEAIAAGEHVEICEPHHFNKEFLPALKKDLRILSDLCNKWESIKDDPKLDEFLLQLETKLCAPEINHHAKTKGTPKLVIFSESKETTQYLANQLKEHGYKRILIVDSQSRNHVMPKVRANFDANVPEEEKEDDFDIIISTEVLAEGVNLHRSNVIVNYDTPWNSTRLMQRIGRVNRIGTQANQIHVFNFFPTSQVDDSIELRKKALVKLQAFHSALGEDSQIYSTDEDVDSFGLFDSELEEDRDESLNLLMDLRKFRKQNPSRFREIRNLPLRARTGRKSKIHSGHTITFIKNNRRDAFYYIKDGESTPEAQELSFVEAARIFHAVAKELPIPLHQQHHTHVTTAVQHFHAQVEESATRDRVVDHQIGPNEKRAIKLISPFLTLPLASEGEKSLLKLAQSSIRRGAFAKLPRQLVKLDKAHRKSPYKPAHLLDKILSIIQDYPLRKADDDTTSTLDAHIGFSSQDLQPRIILSESFSSSSDSI